MLLVHTFKAGLLSKVAHDLQIRLEAFEVRVEGNSVEAEFDPNGLTVEGAMKNGAIDPGSLDAADCRTIERTIRDEILRTRRHPRIHFAGTTEPSGNPQRVAGTLEMLGRGAPIAFPIERTQGRVSGTVELVPSRWGIAPYKAMLGAIRLQDRVIVRFDLADEW